MPKGSSAPNTTAIPNTAATPNTAAAPNTAAKPTSAKLRWLRLAAGLVMFIFAGIIYAWSILKAPLAAELKWDNAQLGLNFTITMGCFCIGGIVGSLLQKKFSQQIVTIIGGALSFLGFFLSSRAQNSVIFLYFSYGCLAGLGIGIVYNVVIASVSSWFLDKRATASGVMMMGFGTSSLLLGSAMNKLFDSLGWRQAYLIFGIAIFLVLFLGSFLMKPNTEARTTRTKMTHAADSRPPEMLKTPTFWMFYSFTILVSLIGTGVISFGKDVALSVGASEALAVLLVGALAVSNGVSRIITGYCFDTIGHTKTMYLSSSVAILSALTMMGAVYFNAVPLVAIGVVMVGLSYGSVPPIGSGFVSKFYGSKYFATNFSIANTQLLFSSFSATLSGMLLRNGGNYILIFVVFLIALIFAILLNLLIQRKQSQA